MISLIMFVVLGTACSPVQSRPATDLPSVTPVVESATTAPSSTPADTLDTAALGTPDLSKPWKLPSALDGDQLSPAWSLDGRRIVFASEDITSAVRSLYSVELTSGMLSRLTNDVTSDILPQYSPDGQHVLYLADLVNPDKLTSAIKVVDVNTGVISQVGDDSDLVLAAVWSPEGARIAFVSNKGGEERLWVVNADGSGAKLLTPGLAGIRGPLWSPNGAYLAVTAWALDGAYAEIHVIDSSTGADRKLTSAAENAIQAAWSADSLRLFYLSGLSIFAITADGMRRDKVLTFPAAINDFSISPDGTRIAYSMGSDEDLDMYISGLDGSDLHCYRHAGTHDIFAVWSPDNKMLVIESFVPHRGPIQLYLLRLDDLPACPASAPD